MKPDHATRHAIAPPGTRMAPRRNVGWGERAVALAAGGALAIVAGRSKGATATVLGLASAALAARGATGAAPLQRYAGQGPDEKSFARKAGWRSAAIASRAVTIGASRRAVYDYFRRFENLGSFMIGVVSVVETDGMLHWVTRDPAGEVAWNARITADVPGEVLAWESVNSRVPTKTVIGFRDAPGGRGTEVHGTVAYRPPGGTAGKFIGKLTQREPGIQLRRDLKRLKSMIETGETATNLPQGSEPKA